MGRRKKNKPLKPKKTNNGSMRSKVIDWLEDVGTLIKEHKNLMLIIVVFIAFVVGAIVVSTTIAKRKSEAQAQAEAEAQAAAQQQYVVTDEPLEVDAYPEINALMRQYYDAAANGDVNTLMSIKSSVDEKEKIVLVKKAELIENYPVVTVYSKKGPEENTFVVFAYYEVKLNDFEELVPGLNAWYVCQREDGSYYINDDEQSADLENYCKLISVQDDVVDLHNTVNVKFNEVVAQDETLATFLDSITDVLIAAVGEELVKEDTAANEPEVTEVVEEETPGETVALKGKATDVVNIRTSDSENADRIGKAQKGDIFTVLEQKANGWSKIEYDGSEAFIKSEYLEILSDGGTQQADSGDSTPTNNNADDTTNLEAAANSPSSGTATATSTINVRKSPSTEADKLAVCYQGERLTVVQKQSDGWTKVKYNGKTGYVKSEYLE